MKWLATREQNSKWQVVIAPKRASETVLSEFCIICLRMKVQRTGPPMTHGSLSMWLSVAVDLQI